MHRSKLIFIAVIGLLPILLIGCGDKVNPDPRTLTPLVRVGNVEAASPLSRTFTGTVAARVQSDLGFRVSGKVLERLVDVGQVVKLGQPLMQIDAKDLQLETQVRQEAVIAAKARAHQATEDEARYREVMAAGAVSASAYDQAKAAADSARAQLNAAEAQAGVAKNASSYAVLIADADGVVVETLAEPGQVVAAGQVVVRIAKAGQREAVVNLPETLRPSLGSVAQASLYGQNSSTQAKLRQLSSVADSLTRTFEARYVLEGALAHASLGATVTIRIPENGVTSQNNSLQVPIGAIFDAGKGPGVWIVDGTPKHVTWRAVKIKGLDDTYVRIENSLQKGAMIVTLGANLLREGEQVRVLGNESATLSNVASLSGEAK
ncbi:efflux RND transporter periplasmic adaptor subunit [Methylotenera sp.]|uniref:efflux RND transporter periplasmic adaptor subunit n=1 Tax=Methylotenera sp. TaxID=2051956 RepID=UPI002733DE8E|nr:efflux RND transporter periplasmic adaptor subunit [Methylotenera sp.]MDP3308620.1 efflux RND transporter periplasmic adaptor subunit [Methylotenera sp.]